MTPFSRFSAALMLPLLAGCGMAAANSDEATPAGDAVRCAIETTRSGGGVSVLAVAGSKAPTSGTYRLTVTGGGGNSTSIRQGGEFSVGPTADAELGRVIVGPGSYDVRLDLTASNGTASCREHVGSI